MSKSYTEKDLEPYKIKFEKITTKKEILLELLFGHSHDNRERIRGINSHAYFIKEDFGEDLSPGVLDHLELIR